MFVPSTVYLAPRELLAARAVEQLLRAHGEHDGRRLRGSAGAEVTVTEPPAAALAVQVVAVHGVVVKSHALP